MIRHADNCKRKPCKCGYDDQKKRQIQNKKNLEKPAVKDIEKSTFKIRKSTK